MANNFTKTGDRYFAKAPAGHDSNSGLDGDYPQATPSNLPNVTCVLGTGDYTVGSRSNRFIGDGKVVLRNLSVSINTTISHWFIHQIYLINANITSTSTGNGRTRCAYDCVFEDSYISLVASNAQAGGHQNHEYLTLVNTSGHLIYSSIGSIVFRYFNLLNGSNILMNGSFAWNFYIDFSSKIRFSTHDNINFRTSNIRGIIEIDSTGDQYAIQDALVGSPQDNGYAAGVKWLTYANLAADGFTGLEADVEVWLENSINKDPLFNNPDAGDYSLQPGSPNILSDGTQIGNSKVALSILNTDDGVGNTVVEPNAEINTGDPQNFTVKLGENEGYVDYIFKAGSVALQLNGAIEAIADLNFNTDFGGGSEQNNNVPDSFPQAVDFPDELVTDALAPDTTTLKITGHGKVVGQFVRVLGEDREITAIPDANTITVDSAFRAAVASGVTVQVGSENQLAALKPNALTYELRTSNQQAMPTTDAEWDNGLSAGLGMAGVFFTQRMFEKPTLLVDGANVYGSGDPDRPAGDGAIITWIWACVRMYLRNNYRS